MFFAVLSCCLGMEAQHAAPHNNVSHNSITINNIPNIFIVEKSEYAVTVV